MIPVTLFLSLFHVLALGGGVADAQSIVLGVGLVMVGLMPFSENIGHLMPQRFSLASVLEVAFVLGAAVTFAEPAIGALKTVGSLTDRDQAPVLHYLLNRQPEAVVYAAAASVGLAVLVSMPRFMGGLEPEEAGDLGHAALPAAHRLYGPGPGPGAGDRPGLAWDCGGITTGPVTVPLVLAMGLGLGRAVEAVEGFGILAMASVGPIISVLAVSLWVQVRERIYQFDLARVET